MTLVLSCATREFLFQVSDRRLTSLVSKAIIDDEANKAVLVGSRMAFGYTGLAYVGTERTDLWLTRVAADGSTLDLAKVCERIRERASKGISSSSQHAFVGIGWTRSLVSSPFPPAYGWTPAPIGTRLVGLSVARLGRWHIVLAGGRA